MSSFTYCLPAQERTAVEIITSGFLLGKIEIPFQRRELFIVCVYFEVNEQYEPVCLKAHI